MLQALQGEDIMGEQNHKLPYLPNCRYVLHSIKRLNVALQKRSLKPGASNEWSHSRNLKTVQHDSGLSKPIKKYVMDMITAEGKGTIGKSFALKVHRIAKAFPNLTTLLGCRF